MGIDLDKLTPWPWASVKQWGGDYVLAHEKGQLAVFGHEADCDFAALARNAFEVMMRRGWSPQQHRGMLSASWFVTTEEGQPFDSCGMRLFHTDPVTALVEADRWYRENVEKE